MTTENIHMDEKSYLKGISLSNSIFEFATDELYEAWENTSSVIPSQRDKNDISATIKGALDSLLAIEENKARRIKIEKELKEDILDLIENSHLTAWGFKLPRNIEDKPIKIPADLILNGEINWNKSELNSQGIEITGIRLFKKIEFNEKTELKLVSNNLNLDKKEVKNKISEIKTIKKTNFADLDSELHIDEKKAAEFLGISPRTMQGYRSKGGGPKFRKIGQRTVRYKIKDLIDWTNDRNNTSE